jgi:hypothetical protein
MQQPLFIQPELEFVKTAGEVDLPEDPNSWPKEILDELFKQVPYITDFQPHVTMDKVDAERGYGFGHVEITNQTEAQMGTDPQQMAAAGIRMVRLPIVIRDGKLTPFDLLVNDASKVLPLTEARLRQSLFRPQAFDITSQTPGDHSMIGQLYPPFRNNYGFGGGGMAMPADMGKMGSAELTFEEKMIRALEERDGGFRRPGEQEKKASSFEGFSATEFKTSSVLDAILPTITQSALTNFWGGIEKSAGVKARLAQNAEAVADSMQKLATVQPVSMEKRANALPQLVRPTVVQIQKHDSLGYIVKKANHDYWDVFDQSVDRGELVEQFGEKIAFDVDTAGAVTLADGADATEMAKQAEVSPVSDAGVYKVFTEEGKELVGFVIPNLIDTDGQSLPLALFTNGSHSTVQSDIHGEPVSEGVNMPTGPAGGLGVFFDVDDDGEIQATIPLELQGSYQQGEEPGTFSGSTYDGRPVEVSQQPNIQEPIGMDEGKLLIPEGWQWSPLGDAEQVALAGGDDATEEQEAEKESSAVHVRSDGETFSFWGSPIAKLAELETKFLDIDAAMFLLAGLGVDQGYGATKLAHAMTGLGPEHIRVSRNITPASELQRESLERAKLAMAELPVLRVDLTKEAAVIPDPSAVDTVLSIGFLNPENLMTFVSYLPSIDSSQTKMCELLLASRLGLKDIPSSALERAVRSVEEVIEGLKVIAFQGS